MLTKLLNETRKADMKQADQSLRQEIHRSRFTWLRHGASLELEQIQQIQLLSNSLKHTGLVWYFKEKAREIWKGYRVKGARAAWNDWIQLAQLTGIRSLSALATQLEKRLFGILNAMRFRASNGLAEAINRQVQALKVRARGFRNKERFKRAILFHYGGLCMAPNPHE